MDEILGDRPVTSVSNVLMGAMPGLQVTGTSGQPGAAKQSISVELPASMPVPQLVFR